MGYIARLAKRIYNEYGEYRKLRIIVIYTADVRRGSTKNVLDMGGTVLRIDEAFLSDLNPKVIKKRLTRKVREGKPFTDRDIMELVIYPLTYRGREAQQPAVTEAIDISDNITNEKQRRMAASGILAFTDKIISDEDLERIERRLAMTKIEKYYADRQEKAVKEAVKEADEKAREEAEKEKKEIAIKMLKTGDSIEKVSECLNIPQGVVQLLATET